MIEFRAILTRDLKFEGTFKLSRGEIVYVRETPSGWLGTYYEKKGAGHGFGLDQNDFSILESGECRIADIVVMPDPETPSEYARQERVLARRRLESRMQRHREQADEIAELLAAV